jgi:hypothetical protein
MAFWGGKKITIEHLKEVSNLEIIGIVNKLCIARFIMCGMQWIPMRWGACLVLIKVVTPNLMP